MKDFLRRAFLQFKRMAFVLCSVLVLYYILKFCVDQLAPLMPESWEQRLGQRTIATLSTDNENYPKTVRSLQEKVDALAKHLPGESKRYQVHLIASDEVNASALPGRHIFVYRGLLDFVSSEEELSCILGHELGHIHHRDHLRDMGHSFIPKILSTVAFFALDIDLDNILFKESYIFAERHYSREQELAADKIGLDLTQAVHQHVGGCTDFFKKLAALEEGQNGVFQQLLLTHPPSQQRVDALTLRTAQKQYPVRASSPIDMLKVAQIDFVETLIRQNNPKHYCNWKYYDSFALMLPCNPSEAAKELLSVDLINTKLQTTIGIISEFSKKPVIITTAVRGTITIKKYDIAWSDLLNILAQENNLVWEERSNVIFVDGKADLAQNE